MAFQDDKPIEVGFFDIPMEQALLGAMLVDETAIARASSICDPDDFYDPLHQRLAEFMFATQAEGKSVSPLTVGAGLANDPGLLELGKLNALGDPRLYLKTLARAASALPNVEDYCRILGELRSKREAVEAMAYGKELLETDHNVAEALAPLIAVFDRSEARSQTVESSRSAGAAGYALLKEAEEQKARGKSIACPTGLDALDDLIGGLYPENLIVIGGRPGMGKSILGSSIVKAAARNGFAPHWFSLEMAARECSSRLIADWDFDHAAAQNLSGIAYSTLLHHRPLTDDQWTRVFKAQNEIAALPIEINDRPKLNIDQISGLARARAARISLPPLVVIDHLHIVAPSERMRKGNRTRNDEIAEVTWGGKQLAKRLKCPVVMLAQLNRDLERREDKHPQIADFRESGSVEQDADVILALYRAAYYAAQMIRLAKTAEQRTNAETVAAAKEKVLEIEALKNRAGATKTIEAWIEIKSSAVRNSDPTKAKAIENGSGLLDLMQTAELRG